MYIHPFLAAVLFLASFFGVTVSAGAETVNRIAAVVNEDVITVHQIEKELQALVTAGDIPPGSEDGGRRLVLDQLIDKTLLDQRIKELGLAVSEEEMEAAIQDVLKQNQLNRDQLEAALEQQGMSFSAYREGLRQQILRYKLIGREVQNRTEVTNQEIRDYFREHIDDYRQAASVGLNRLTVSLPPRASEEQVEEARRKAGEAQARLRRGEEFSVVLVSYAADRSVEGGDMGNFAPGELAASFERAVSGLQEGEVSEVVATPQGFTILQVSERNAGKIRHFDSVKDEIGRLLGERKTQDRLKEWSEDLKKKAYIEIRI